MKTLLLLLPLLAFGAASARAQAAADTYALGDRTVVIPPPPGFVEATSRSEVLKKFFEAAEATALDTLAVHVPTANMERFERGDYHDLDFYTKVSVSKSLRAEASTPAYFAALVARLRAENARIFDVNSAHMRDQLKAHNKSLSEFLKEDTRLSLSQPVTLGEIESTPSSYGALLLTKATFHVGDERKVKMLASGASAVLVRGRIVWVYTYKVFNTDKDADDLRAFTKRWLGEIVRANR